MSYPKVLFSNSVQVTVVDIFIASGPSILDLERASQIREAFRASDYETRDGSRSTPNDSSRENCVVIVWSKESVEEYSRKKRIKSIVDNAFKKNNLISVKIDEVMLPRKFRSMDTFHLTGWPGDDLYNKQIRDILFKFDAIESRISIVEKLKVLVGNVRKQIDETTVVPDEYSSVFHSTFIPKAVFIPGKRIVEMNQAFCKWAGYSKQELHYLPFEKLVHEDNQITEDAFPRWVKQENPDVYRKETKFIRKTGQTVWGLLNVAAFSGKSQENGTTKSSRFSGNPEEDGSIYAPYCVAEIYDTTRLRALAAARKKAEDELSISEESLQKVLAELEAEREAPLQIKVRDLEEDKEKAIQNREKLQEALNAVLAEQEKEKALFQDKENTYQNKVEKLEVEKEKAIQNIEELKKDLEKANNIIEEDRKLSEANEASFQNQIRELEEANGKVYQSQEELQKVLEEEIRSKESALKEKQAIAAKAKRLEGLLSSSGIYFHEKGEEDASKKIFISYRRADSEDLTLRIRDRLVDTFGEQAIFTDTVSIPLGSEFPKVIEGMVSSCDAFIAVIGKDWLGKNGSSGFRIQEENDFVKLELEAAIKREIPVIPLFVKHAVMPDKTHLPDGIKGITDRHGVSVRSGRDFKNDVAYFIDQLKLLLD